MNAIPIVGWLISFIFCASTAFPFWIVWTVCGIGSKYFYFLPAVYHGIGFWESVGLFTVIGILKRVFTPQFANVTQKNEAAKQKSETAK